VQSPGDRAAGPWDREGGSVAAGPGAVRGQLAAGGTSGRSLRACRSGWSGGPGGGLTGPAAGSSGRLPLVGGTRSTGPAATCGKLSGIGRRVAPFSPPQIRACKFPSTRLPAPGSQPRGAPPDLQPPG
jgi:hypothetical protein